MLFGNVESSIQVFSTEEVTSGVERYRETVHRVLELGIAYPLEQIIQWANDLGSWVDERERPG
jgi:hypothetical protein